jgi:hypothetical protein
LQRQYLARVGRSDPRDVGGERLAARTAARIVIAAQLRPGRARRREEALARARIVGGEAGREIEGMVERMASHGIASSGR